MEEKDYKKMEDGKLYVIRSEMKFFLNRTEEISTIGRFPPRGVYTRLFVMTDMMYAYIWFDSNNNEITNEQWINELNIMSEGTSKYPLLKQ